MKACRSRLAKKLEDTYEYQQALWKAMECKDTYFEFEVDGKKYKLRLVSPNND